MFPGHNNIHVADSIKRIAARHADAAKRITSCTTCDNKSRQKFKPTLDIKIKGGTTHTHADIDNIAIIKVGCGLIKSSYN